MVMLWFFAGVFFGTMAGVFLVALFQMASRKSPYPDADDLCMDSFPCRLSTAGDLAMGPSKEEATLVGRSKEESQPLCEQGA